MGTGIIMDQRSGREETALIRAKYKLIRVVFTGGLVFDPTYYCGVYKSILNTLLPLGYN
jgi:hypothetical protein